MNPRLDRLFRKHRLSVVRPFIHALAGRAIRLTTHSVTKDKPVEKGKTKFGGRPDVPPGFRWPRFQGRPLTFIAQIEASLGSSIGGLPESGLLYFFYDVQDQPWGYDPMDRGSWSISHVDAPAKTLRPMPMPARKRLHPDEGGPLPECLVRASTITTIPPPGNLALSPILLNEKHRLAYHELYEEFSGSADDASHQLFGWPRVVQSDMEVCCQWAFHDINCGGMDDAIDSPRARVLAGGATRWQLMLQVGSDDNLGVMWGDMGKLYFYATAEARASQRFDESWVVLQCS